MSGRICKAACELSEPVGSRRAVCNREDFQKRSHRLRCGRSRRQRWNVSDTNHRLPQSQSFVRREEKYPVTFDWSTKRASERVQSFWRLAQPETVGKPIVRIERVVAEEVERRTMKCICSGARDHFNLSARNTTVFRLHG